MSDRLTHVQITGGTPSSSSLYPNFQDIPGMSMKADAAAGDQFLVTLTAPDTWNDTEGGGGWFAIVFNKNIVARGVFTTGAPGQRVPISLQTVVTVAKTGTCQFSAKFCCAFKGSVVVGAFSQTVLTALRV